MQRLIKMLMLSALILIFTACSQVNDANLGRQQLLGEVLVESQLAISNLDTSHDFETLIEFGLDTRYSQFVRAWLYFERDLLIDQIQRSSNAEALERKSIIDQLIRRIDLE
ncbi:hypothetical protein DBZ36_17460 [Alginatibacterium sediminis]|uniref:DUF4296 domain-containing protein n=1 Tax=Alginatibacterium sediminis TaxID=2164068 RepID=A0A420E718_9ALTE|nr:hypothetical protein [Alginatibacterium sediminis]RKF14440.1 hypothetical protein DBZ36_17460 [Alginatibacterium sediminis]